MPVKAEEAAGTSPKKEDETAKATTEVPKEEGNVDMRPSKVEEEKIEPEKPEDANAKVVEPE